MLDSLSLSTNAAMSAMEEIDFLTRNIINGDRAGYNASRYSFRDYLFGGSIEGSGNSWRQGKKSVRVGEPTKMMLSGKGLFSLVDPTTKDIVYSRLGDFHFDRNGYLVTNEGFMVLGTALGSNVQRTNNLNTINANTPDTRMTAFADPFSNPATDNYEKVVAGAPVGRPEPINLYLDPTNGKYLGKYDKIRVDNDGVIWGKYGDSEVSLYKVSLRSFQNFNGLKNFRDVYWKETSSSGTALPSNAKVFNEALEKSNVNTKVEIDYIVEAQRQYSAALNSHKIADRLLQQAIELVG